MIPADPETTQQLGKGRTNIYFSEGRALPRRLGKIISQKPQDFEASEHPSHKGHFHHHPQTPTLLAIHQHLGFHLEHKRIVLCTLMLRNIISLLKVSSLRMISVSLQDVDLGTLDVSVAR
jgi:hypothetical protein